MLKIGIIGRSELMYDSMVLMHKGKHKVSYVITAKEAPEYQKTREHFSDFCVSNQIPFHTCSNFKSDETKEFLKKYGDVDIVLSVNFSGIIPQKIIDTARIGFLNAHGGDLPKYRGNACQAWAMLNGEEKIAICIHKMVGGELDNGDIIIKDFLSISNQTKILDVWLWMNARIPQLFEESVEKLFQEPIFILEKQSKDPSKALRCYSRRPEDAQVYWSQNALNILRLINASGDPYDGAFTSLDDEKLYIWDAEIVDDLERFCAIPGQIIEILRDGSVVVACGEMTKIKLITVSKTKGKRSNANQYLYSTRQRLTLSGW